MDGSVCRGAQKSNSPLDAAILSTGSKLAALAAISPCVSDLLKLWLGWLRDVFCFCYYLL